MTDYTLRWPDAYIVGRQLVVDPVDPAGLVSALLFAGQKASATEQWTVRLIPGTYTPTATLTLPSYVTIVGSGRNCTRIDVSALTTGLDATGSINSSLNDLEVYGVSASINPQLLILADAQGFALRSVKMTCTAVSSGGFCFKKFDTSDHTANSAYDLIIEDSQFVAIAFDNFLINSCNMKVYSSLFQNTPTISGSDCCRLQHGTFEFYGCTILMFSAQTYSAASNGAAIQLGGSGTWTLYLIGTRVLFDLSSGDVNGASAVWGPINSGVTNEDWTMFIEGSQIDYKTGTITSAAAIGGFIVGNAGANATNGTIRVVGSQFRDLGGSGGTLRTDIVVNGTAVGGSKIIKSLTIVGSKVKWDYKLAGGFLPIPGNYGITEPTQNFQGSSVTFATGASVSVTMPLGFPINVTDYVVTLEPSVNETFWVTGKSNSSFVLNSSNASSTANVRYVVER